MLNKVLLIGNLTRDPEGGTSSSGVVYSRFTIAVNSSTKDNKSTSFIPCVAFSSSANFLNAYAKRGDRVFIEARITTQISFDERIGKNISSLSVVANNVQMLTSKRDETNQIFSTPNPSRNQIIDSNIASYNTDEAFAVINNAKSHTHNDIDTSGSDMDDDWMDDFDEE